MRSTCVQCAQQEKIKVLTITLWGREEQGRRPVVGGPGLRAVPHGLVRATQRQVLTCNVIIRTAVLVLLAAVIRVKVFCVVTVGSVVGAVIVVLTDVIVVITAAAAVVTTTAAAISVSVQLARATLGMSQTRARVLTVK